MSEVATQASQPRGMKTRPGEGQAYWFFGMKAILRSPEEARPIIIEHHLAPGGHTPLHVHNQVEDSFYLLAGRVLVRCGDDTFTASPGDYVSLPAGVPHTLYVLDGRPATLLQTHASADFLNFIKAAGTPVKGEEHAPAEPLDFDRLFRIAAETGQPVLGAPMTDEEAAAAAS